MRRVFGWMMVVALCCASVEAAEEKPDARLVEAQTEFDAATKLKEAGAYPDALRRAEHALALREAVLGSTHLEVASCLHLIADLRLRQGDPTHAEPLLQRVLTLREDALGKDHPDVAATLNTLANVYVSQGQYNRAESLYQRAIALREAALGQNHPDVALSLSNLASLYTKQGQYNRAEPLYQRAIAIREAALGQNHPLVATSLHNLAGLYVWQGQYNRAESLYRRELAIRETALGPSHPDVAASLYDFAGLYYDRGLYSEAEPLFQRALTIWEAALGPNHPAIAFPLRGLAQLYAQQGAYDRAEALSQRAITLQEAALGKSHPDVAYSLDILANLYGKQGRYGRAEPLFQRSLALREAALGKGHPDVATSLHNLANLYVDKGRYGQAASLYQRSLALREAALGKSHPDVATSLHRLAKLYVKQGGDGRAEPLFQRALALREAALGKDHPNIAESLNEFAQLRLAQHRLPEALALLTRAFSLSEHRLRLEALEFSESRLSSFLRYVREEEQTIQAMLRAHPEDERVRRLALGAVLLLKGRSVEETANISRAVYQSLGAEDRDALEQLRGLRTHLAALSLAGPGALSPEDYQRQLKTLADEGDLLEADLAKRSAPLRSRTTLPSLDGIVERVAASLPKDGALIEFIAYGDSPLASRPGTPGVKNARPLRYVALVLFPNASTRAVDLGPATPIDASATRLRDALAQRDTSFQPTARRLHDLVFQPVRALLGTTHRILLSPDGPLGLVPFDALHDGRGFLLDTFDFTYLTSGRELLARPQAPASSIFVLADPDFSAEPISEPPGTNPTPTPLSDSLERFFSTPRPELSGRAWPPLPGSREEARGIQRLLPQAQLFLGADATKERLLGLPTPGILHLATHGFFLGNAPSSASGARGVAFVEALGNPPPPQQEPLLNSGLVLAGASASHSEASLVTALEVAGLDLWGTQLVVLSACDTGRGEVHLGQGIYGLRRALVVAGAETVVMSLWKVNDDSTRLLMDTYYRNLLAGQGRASALREAMRSLRASHPHPHHWAPFIALGSDAPLNALTPLAGEAED